MPYIKQEDRKRLDPHISNLAVELETKGEFNYAMTKLLLAYLKRKPLSYAQLSNTHGLASDVANEFFRTHFAEYEDRKRQENGKIE